MGVHEGLLSNRTDTRDTDIQHSLPSVQAAVTLKPAQVTSRAYAIRGAIQCVHDAWATHLVVGLCAVRYLSTGEISLKMLPIACA